MGFLNKYYNCILRLYDKKVDATGLSIFRIMYAAVLLCEIIQLFYFRNLIFDKIPFVVSSEVDFSWALKAWMLVVLMLMVGLYTRWATIINYLFSLTFIATIGSYEYHMFYVYMLLNFLMIFLDVSRVNSLDHLLLKLRLSKSHTLHATHTKVSVLNYHVVVFLAIGFVYFDSIFFKFSSTFIWMKGLGMWLPAANPQITHVDASPILNSKWLMWFLGYLTVAFEAVFIFTFFRKKWRVPLMIVGIGLHVGILVEFPIPWFALGVIGCYVLMVPFSWWRCLARKMKLRQSFITVYYNKESLSGIRSFIIVNHFDWFGAVSYVPIQELSLLPDALNAYSMDQLLASSHGVTRSHKALSGVRLYVFILKRLLPTFWLGFLLEIPGFSQIGKLFYSSIKNGDWSKAIPIVPSLYNNDTFKISEKYTFKQAKVWVIATFLLLLMTVQTLILYRSWLIQDIRRNTGFMGTSKDAFIEKKVLALEHYFKVFMGITHHAVFMDYHFKGYNHVIAVEAEDANGKRYWLPIINKDGTAGKYIYSFNWVKWTFRVNGPQVDDELLKIGVRDFTNFWAKKHGFQIMSMKYHIYVKKIDTPNGWEHDFLHRQMEKPWIEAGEAAWIDGQFVWNVKEVEKI